jgi:thiamine-monophosphate kinase
MVRGEFDLINHFKKLYGLEKVGDDCAVLPMSSERDLLITADMLVEDVDFRLAWTNPLDLGHKALAVSLSDIAAMGGRPRWAMLSLAIPETFRNDDLLDEFYRGWHELAVRFGVELVGGDISSIEGKFVVDSIVGGDCEKGKAILRSTAKAGALIYVSGSLGGSAAGLELLESGKTDETGLVQRHSRPEPRLDLSQKLVELDIPTAMIDISDGLSSDLAHICSASGTGARIYSERIPIDTKITGLDKAKRLDLALNGGEDFELLFTVDPANASLLTKMDVTRIGEMTEGADMMLISDDGEEMLVPGGFRHF